MIRYLPALLATGVALALALSIHPVLDGVTFLVFIAAVAATSALSGLAPGLLATLLSVLAIDFFFLFPPRTLRVLLTTDALSLVVFGGVALLVSWLTGVLHAKRQRAERHAVEAAGMASLLERQLVELEGDRAARDVLRPDQPTLRLERPEQS